MENEMEDKGKFVRYAVCVMAAFFLAGTWYASYLVAAKCGFNKLLGWGVEIGGWHIYFPLAYFLWQLDPNITAAIPNILRSGKLPVMVALLLGGFICYLMKKNFTQMTSHGTARFAKKDDIKAAKLDAKSNGVVVGTNPFTNEIMLHDGPEHVFLAAPTRSGKGVGIIIPTAITWHNSAFFFDPKQELWIHTAGYRKRVMRQKVIKFEPLCSDDSGARWNPYAEIDFRGLKEIDDTRTVNQTIVKTDEGGNKDPFWDDSAIGLLNGVTIHLLYKHYREGRPLPCPSDTISFLASPTMDKPHLFTSMKIYPHISPEEFLESEYVDENGQTKKHRNPLKEIYGEYIPDLKPFKKALKIAEDSEEWNKISTLEDLRQYMAHAITVEKKIIPWNTPDIDKCKNKEQIDETLQSAVDLYPFYQLLVHPKVAEEAQKILGNAEQTGASIISSAQTPLNLYQDPLIKRNTCVSDFCFRDLLDPQQAVSLYLVIQPNDVPKLRPLTRLFVNTMLAKTVRDMKFDVPANKKQRLLMMLDEFPQLKKLDSIENTLAICAGYGVKICTVVQSITQLNQIYTKDNSILDNSQVQIYMTPSNLAAAKELSEIMGDSTIKSVSKSSSGKLFESNNSVSEQGRKLMNPDELLRMSKDMELVIAQGCRPIMCKKIKWFLEPFFKERVLVIPAPTFSDTKTEVKTYEQLFAVNAADVADMEERQAAVAKAKAAIAEKEAAKEEAKKVSLEKAMPEKSADNDEPKETTQEEETPSANDEQEPKPAEDAVETTEPSEKPAENAGTDEQKDATEETRGTLEGTRSPDPEPVEETEVTKTGETTDDDTDKDVDGDDADEPTSEAQAPSTVTADNKGKTDSSPPTENVEYATGEEIYDDAEDEDDEEEAEPEEYPTAPRTAWDLNHRSKKEEYQQSEAEREFFRNRRAKKK
ncbi:MAG: type IV secretory system conjugative DNA transfer family protein [Selenomonadaceae bacterium]|nr:type IV secretory system conjugative DNA transfer family protein [Selenomonadaceae bacterium]